jgi:hypothetical protein
MAVVADELGRAAAGAAAGAAVQKGAQAGKSWWQGKTPPTWMLLAGAAGIMAWLYVQHSRQRAQNAVSVGTYPSLPAISDPGSYGSSPGYATTTDIASANQAIASVAAQEQNDVMTVKTQIDRILNPVPGDHSPPVATASLFARALGSLSSLPQWGGAIAGWDAQHPGIPVRKTPGGDIIGYVPWGQAATAAGTPISGPAMPWQPSLWDPVTFGGLQGFVNEGDWSPPHNPPVAAQAAAVGGGPPAVAPLQPTVLGSLRTDGRSLPQLAQQVYGDPSQWPRLARANPGKIVNPANVPAGITLTIPN